MSVNGGNRKTQRAFGALAAPACSASPCLSAFRTLLCGLEWLAGCQSCINTNQSPVSHHTSVTIKAGPSGTAVLCTADATYDLKTVETSNSLLLVPEGEVRKGGGR